METEWGRTTLRVLPRLLTAEHGQVEVRDAVVELFDACLYGWLAGVLATRTVDPVRRDR